MPNDDIIRIVPKGHKEPIIGIFEEDNGTISFSSSLSPQKTAKIFAGLLNHIMENEIG